MTLHRFRFHCRQRFFAYITVIGMGVVCTSPGSGGVSRGGSGSGGGVFGLVATG